MAAFRSIAGSFSAVVVDAARQGLPYDPLGFGRGAIAAGFSFAGRYAVADSGYAHYCQEPGRIAAFSDANQGLIAVQFTFGTAVHTQPGTSFSRVTYHSSRNTDAYDRQSLSANTAISATTFTLTQLFLTPNRPVRATDLRHLIDTPFEAEAGSMEFHAFNHDKIIGGFIAKITQASHG